MTQSTKLSVGGASTPLGSYQNPNYDIGNERAQATLGQTFSVQDLIHIHKKYRTKDAGGIYRYVDLSQYLNNLTPEDFKTFLVKDYTRATQGATLARTQEAILKEDHTMVLLDFSLAYRPVYVCYIFEITPNVIKYIQQFKSIKLQNAKEMVNRNIRYVNRPTLVLAMDLGFCYNIPYHITQEWPNYSMTNAEWDNMIRELVQEDGNRLRYIRLILNVTSSTGMVNPEHIPNKLFKTEEPWMPKYTSNNNFYNYIQESDELIRIALESNGHAIAYIEYPTLEYQYLAANSKKFIIPGGSRSMKAQELITKGYITEASLDYDPGMTIKSAAKC